MNVTGGVELRHKERIGVPEIRFDERPVKFLEAEGGELIFDTFQKINVGVCPAGDNAGWRQLDIVAAEGLRFPCTRFKAFGRQLSGFVAGNARRIQCLLHCGNHIRKGVDNLVPFNNLECGIRCAALFRNIGDAGLFVIR